MGREYLVQCEEEPGFKLVSGIDILEGEYRGREYRSAATDLGVAQKSVLETLNDSQNSHHRIQDRHQKLSALLPAYHDNFENQRQALQTKFARLRSVIDVLEEAVMDKATACYEEDVALVTAELERCNELSAGLEHHCQVARAFVWDQKAKNAKAPAAVAHADLALAEIGAEAFSAVETRDASDLINLSTIENTAIHLEQCALQSGLQLQAPQYTGAVDQSAHTGYVVDAAQPDSQVNVLSNVFERLHRDAVKKQLVPPTIPADFVNSVENTAVLRALHSGHADLSRSPGVSLHRSPNVSNGRSPNVSIGRQIDVQDWSSP